MSEISAFRRKEALELFKNLVPEVCKPFSNSKLGWFAGAYSRALAKREINIKASELREAFENQGFDNV